MSEFMGKAESESIRLPTENEIVNSNFSEVVGNKCDSREASLEVRRRHKVEAITNVDDIFNRNGNLAAPSIVRKALSRRLCDLVIRQRRDMDGHRHNLLSPPNEVDQFVHLPCRQGLTL